MGWFTGSKAKIRTRSRLEAGQEPIKGQLLNAAQGPGAGGAYGDAADYWRNNLSDDPETMKMLAAPEMRKFNEQIIPDLSEQFAGMGSGGLSSSGFRNAAVGAGTDLSERLGAIRAKLRENAAQGLTNIGKDSLQSFQDTYEEPGSGGFLQAAAPIAGTVLGSFLGPAGAAVGGAAASWATNALSSKGKTSWQGNTNDQAQNVRNSSTSAMYR